MTFTWIIDRMDMMMNQLKVVTWMSVFCALSSMAMADNTLKAGDEGIYFTTQGEMHRIKVVARSGKQCTVSYQRDATKAPSTINCYLITKKKSNPVVKRQTFEDGMGKICAVLTDCIPCLTAKGVDRESKIRPHLKASVTNVQVVKFLKEFWSSSPSGKVTALRAYAKAAGIETCAFADTLASEETVDKVAVDKIETPSKTQATPLSAVPAPTKKPVAEVRAPTPPIKRPEPVKKKALTEAEKAEFKAACTTCEKECDARFEMLSGVRMDEQWDRGESGFVKAFKTGFVSGATSSMVCEARCHRVCSSDALVEAVRGVPPPVELLWYAEKKKKLCRQKNHGTPPGKNEFEQHKNERKRKARLKALKRKVFTLSSAGDLEIERLRYNFSKKSQAFRIRPTRGDLYFSGSKPKAVCEGDDCGGGIRGREAWCIGNYLSEGEGVCDNQHVCQWTPRSLSYVVRVPMSAERAKALSEEKFRVQIKAKFRKIKRHSKCVTSHFRCTKYRKRAPKVDAGAGGLSELKITHVEISSQGEVIYSGKK